MNITPLARSLLARTGRPIPRYGSPEWNALPDGDLRRVAAVVVAAECWRDHCSTERCFEDLIEQQRVDDALVFARIAETSASVHAALPDGWVDACTHAELVQRRAS